MAIKLITLARMKRLHDLMAECGAMSVTDAVLMGGFHKNSCHDWMGRLLEIGCVIQVPAPETSVARSHARCYQITSKPFPEGPLPELKPQRVTGVHEFSRIVRPAVNMGMPRDWLVAAFFGEKRV